MLLVMHWYSNIAPSFGGYRVIAGPICCGERSPPLFNTVEKSLWILSTRPPARGAQSRHVWRTGHGDRLNSLCRANPPYSAAMFVYHSSWLFTLQNYTALILTSKGAFHWFQQMQSVWCAQSNKIYHVIKSN